MFSDKNLTTATLQIATAMFGATVLTVTAIAVAIKERVDTGSFPNLK